MAIMNAAQDRYTDNDLLRMLQVIVSDYNRQPTQREVLADDRLPTHHTYRNRFGTLANALQLAGLGRVPKTKSPTHSAVKECIEDSETTLVGEWVKVGSLVVDFEIEHNGMRCLIDIVDLDNKVPDDVYQSILRMRHHIAMTHGDGRVYVIATGTLDAIRYLTKMA